VVARRLPAFAALAPGLVTVACGLAACGSTTVLGADRTLRLSETEYRLIPQSVDAHQGPITIVVHNYGRLTHNLTVSDNGEQLASTKPIPPGSGTELTLYLSPGTYLMSSTLIDDTPLGEYGTLRVS